MDSRIRSAVLSDLALVVFFVLSGLYGRMEPIVVGIAMLEVSATMLIASLLATLVSSGLVLRLPRVRKAA
jgi:hypothetical protein